MAIAVGAPFQLVPEPEFGPGYLRRLQNHGISSLYTDVIERCRSSGAPNAWAVADLLHRRQQRYAERYGRPRTLPSTMLPSTSERQPYDRVSWGRNGFRYPDLQASNIHHVRHPSQTHPSSHRRSRAETQTHGGKGGTGLLDKKHPFAHFLKHM